ncbi:GSU2403 family nucleotidyltransferase fold protein [Amantichitinum ursilacus]|uniref:Nucleotidyltransferase-like domain-containing protein n=1 Tax=Amantichitinum ursilacus TaxID=857265 RepID=A0A0N1JT91_9NEIS|nr:nucleotidyltransferase domain-containing protein [Amantichitinum ursilacus]KPC54608.1 hypothetical protein WG78_03515 [Amantichitinum ursilacus]
MKSKYFQNVKDSHLRHIIDSQQTFDSLLDAERALHSYKGSMLWRDVGPYTYLIKRDTKGGQTSLGKKNEETLAIYEAFQRNKAEAKASVNDLTQALNERQRINKALGIGRAPQILVDVLNRIREARLDDHILIVGTNAMYAYEAQAGVRFDDSTLATTDVDLLWDSRKRLSVWHAEDIGEDGLLGILKKADKSFALMEDQRYTARNASGYMVDLIKRKRQWLELDEAEEQQIIKSDHDFRAAKIEGLTWLLSSPRFREMIISEKGELAYMDTIDPRAFAIHKHWLASRPGRDPRKARRDKMQSLAVRSLVEHWLPHLPFSGMHAIPESLRAAFAEG